MFPEADDDGVAYEDRGEGEAILARLLARLPEDFAFLLLIQEIDGDDDNSYFKRGLRSYETGASWFHEEILLKEGLSIFLIRKIS